MYSDYSSALGMGVAIIGIWIVAILLILGWSVLSYVLQSLSYYTIAKRRGLKNPWMAWVPVLNSWLLGSISDQYQYVVHGQVKNKRKWLLGLVIAYLVVYIIWEVTMVAGTYRIATGYESVGIMVLMVLGALLMLGLAIALTVVLYIALNDLFRSCDPGHATLYLVLSIVVNITLPFFVFACRKKDLGMPPRRERIPAQPQYMPPQWEQTPAEPVAEAPVEQDTQEEI